MNIGVLYFEKASPVRHFRAILGKLLMAVTSANLLAAQTLPSEVSEQLYKNHGFQHLNNLRIHILRVWRVQSKPELPLCLWATPRAPNFDTIKHPAPGGGGAGLADHGHGIASERVLGLDQRPEGARPCNSEVGVASDSSD